MIVHFVHEPARRDLSIVRDTRARSKLLVDDIAAFEILACARACRHRGGAMAEAGVFAGGTARLICEMEGDVPLLLFDVFETLQGQASPGDDYNLKGVRRAFDDYFSERPDTVIGFTWGQALIVKSAG